MKRFENILLVSDPHDPDEMALERAVSLAKTNQAQLTVAEVMEDSLGTVCRTGMAGFFIGNTAEEILQKVDCSVLTVKPDAFVTPVKLDEQ